MFKNINLDVEYYIGFGIAMLVGVYLFVISYFWKEGMGEINYIYSIFTVYIFFAITLTPIFYTAYSPFEIPYSLSVKNFLKYYGFLMISNLSIHIVLNNFFIINAVEVYYMVYTILMLLSFFFLTNMFFGIDSYVNRRMSEGNKHLFLSNNFRYA